MTVPHRCFIDGRYHLHGRPFLIVGGELHNSGSSTPTEIVRSLDAAVELGVNAVLAPVAWELLEPVEGGFDFTLVDHLINGAQERGLHLVLLWFGTWKNGMSTYAPAWMKLDAQRFPRIRTSSGTTLEAMSPFSTAARDADAHAFATLMRHLAEHDDEKTVLMVQVENEVGVLSDSRDRSPLAEARWAQAVPERVIAAVRDSADGRLADALQLAVGSEDASWQEVFRDEADEAFMATAYASYIEEVARAGRTEFDVPLFVNAWVDANADTDGGDHDLVLGGGIRPGEYPSGGPLRHTSAIWRALAPSLDFLAPDLYFGRFDTIAAEYRAVDGILFIPEMQCNLVGAEQMFRAVGELQAAGVSPFAFDLMARDDPHRDDVKDAFTLLSALGAVLAEFPNAETHGFTLTELEPTRRLFPGAALEVSRDHMADVFLTTRNGMGCIARVDPDTYFVIGRGFAVRALQPDGRRAGWLTAEEVVWADGEWQVIRRLNGDEVGGGEWIRLPSLDTTQSDAFPIRQNISLSGILRVRPYLY